MNVSERHSGNGMFKQGIFTKIRLWQQYLRQTQMLRNCIDSECKEKFTSSVNKAIESKDRAECVLSMHEINGKKHWFKTHLRFVSETGVSSVLIAYFTDVTNMVLTDKRINEYKNYIQDEIDRKHKILIVSNNSDACCQLEEILSQENTVFTAETIQAGKKASS